ncbi:unnamed protein product [Rotaria magnacalcarata]|uniref:Uncharacterized protein n=2 Tax=Rotaria magnacalcarata TaxID=392030 RepID=A0A816MCR0_9BILA|nr:unnamed protein product [Rotaria magnacalcarata]CAF4069627.1 unnamed protein product [Rotaria magnacalcarata]CAF4121635.1 unnamed protein product [Rotaria magnacalcarata]
MPREDRYRCSLCEKQIRDGIRKYSTVGSLLLQVYIAANSGKRVGFDDFICGSCRRQYDRWHESMEDDFDYIDVPIVDDADQVGEECMLMEVDVASRTSAMDILNEEKT